MRVSAIPLFVALLSGIIALSGYVAFAHAETTCPNTGDVPITAATRAAATIAGIPTTMNCWNPKDPNVGEAVGEAKLWLAQHATKNSNISCMNANFAKKLQRFLQAVPGGPPQITDGYRDPSKQAALVRSGASRAGYCVSYHNYGLAADFNNNSKAQTAWMRANSRAYGINTIGGWDPNHFQDADGRYGQCGSCANAGGEGTLPSYQTRPYPDDYYYYQATGQPFSLGQPPMMQSAPAPFPTTPTQAPTQTQTQNPATNQPQICDPKLSCTGNVTYYQTSSCTTQVYQVCQYGCSTTGSACATSTSTAATSTRNQTGTGTGIDITNTNSNDNGNTTTGPSVSELLDRMVNPVSFTSTDVGTSTSLAFRLNPDTGDVETLDASERPKDAVAAGTITSVQQPPGQQTFTSGDLGNTYNGQNGTQSSTFQSVLDGLKSALMWALNVLRGLSGTTAA